MLNENFSRLELISRNTHRLKIKASYDMIAIKNNGLFYLFMIYKDNYLDDWAPSNSQHGMWTIF